ncbi:MAG TPA: chromosomal replication initiator protein DnaA [Clostridia bacterium]|nr:chromosomal replication initiator protein DnaA [Clostridia bacterium]
MQSAQYVWEKSIIELKKQMTTPSFDTWISPIEPLCIRDNSLVLLAQNSIAKNTLINIYTATVTNAVNKANEMSLTISFVDPSEAREYRPEQEAFSSSVSPSSLREMQLNPKYTFDTFVIGNSNSFAHAAAKAVADNPSSAYNPLFIYGGVGLGKTHLMHAIGNHIRSTKPKAKIIYVTSEAFMNEMILAIQENKNAQFRNKYRSVDVLMVDDIQFISTRVGLQEEFFNTFNALHTNGRQIILSSDKPPMEMQTLEVRLRSRFEGGLIADIQPPDIETRAAILRKKVMLENISIDEKVITFIAEKVNSNIRQLEGSLNRVIAYSNLTKRPIDTVLADTALRDILPGFENRRITIELIQQVVADYYSISLDSLLSQRRTMEITYPRQIAMYLCKEMTESSLKSIGRSFGGRDHTTVISACRKIASDLEKDENLSVTVEDLQKRIKK